MRRRARRLIPPPLGLILLLAPGCLAHLPPDDDPVHMQIAWRSSFETAAAEAERTDKPILLVGAGGDITGPC